MHLLRILLCIAVAASLQAAVPILDPRITGTSSQVASGTFTVKSGATLATESGTIFSFAEKLNLASGGTGVSLSDPGADRIMFWDDSAGSVAWLTFGTGLSISGTTATVDTTLFAPADATFITKTASSGLSGEFALGTLTTGLLKVTATSGDLSTAAAATDYVAPGAVTSSGITMATDRLLGRTTASTGNIEELTVGSGLTLSSGTLSATAAAPTTATYITQTADGTLANEQALSALATGLMQVTTSTGVISSVTTSSGLAALISDEVGTGALVFRDSPAFTTHITLPNGTSPTTGAVARQAFDTNAWATDRGAIQINDGTADTWVVATLASDTPSNGQVPTWNTGGTITWETPSGGGGGAPTTATYITQTADGTLSNEQALGALATGILKNTTTTGVLSIAAAGTDYVAPGAATSSGLTMATSRLLGRTTGSSGAIEEITVGSGLTFSSGSLSATGSSGTKTLFRFTALDAQPPSSNYAQFRTRNNVAVLDFDPSTDESTVFVGVIPEGADFTTGIAVRIHWIATSATSNDVIWTAAFERANTDLDSDSFATGVSATSTTNATSGIITTTVINFSGSEIDGLTAGDPFRIKISRDADNGSDTMTGDAEFVVVEGRQR